MFVGVILLSNLTRVLKDYRQRLLNVRVMLSLRRALFDRLLHLPLPKVWDMKTGGILSRLTGDVETTTGLLQMPSCHRRSRDPSHHRDHGAHGMVLRQMESSVENGEAVWR